MIELVQADRLYELSAHMTIRRIRISHARFREFSKTVTDLKRILADSAEEVLWKTLLSDVRRYRFSRASAPIAFSDATVPLEPILKTCRDTMHLFERADSEAALQVAKLLDLGQHLATSNENPLLDAIKTHFRGRIELGALLLKDSRLIPASERALGEGGGFRNWSPVTQGQLRGSRTFSCLLVPGSTRWFADYVFTAPRAREIVILRYDWLNEPVLDKTAFVAGWAATSGDRTEKTEEIDISGVEADDVVPQIDWAAVQRRALNREDESSEEILAKTVVLDSNYAVFLEDSDEATVLTLDLETDEPAERVERIKVKRVQPGMFLLLRTTGGGDYIQPLADKIMGAPAGGLRDLQKDWKAKLRGKVARSSILETSLALINRGSMCANESNVRNWMSSRTIRTQEPEDFAAIMRLVGLENRTDEYWGAMETISRAHQKAGQQIRRMLLKQLAQMDLSDLERDGHLEISIADSDSGTLTAHRVTAIASASIPVGSSKLNHPFLV